MTKKQENLILFILAAINFTHIIDFMIMMPLGPQLMRFFIIKPEQFSYLVASYTISAGISGFLMAFFVDRLNRKKVLLYCYIGFIIGTLCCGIAPTYELLMIARITAGLFGGVLSAQVLSIVGDVVPFERRGKAMGIIMTAFSVASVIGVPFGLWVATKISWHAPFLVVGGLGALLIPIIHRFMPNLKEHIQPYTSFNPLKVIRPILQNKYQQMGILFMVVIILGHFMVIPFLSQYMVANVGFSESQLPFIYFFGGVATFFSSPLVGKLSDKYGKFEVLWIGIVTSMVIVLVITHLPVVPLYEALLISSLFFIFTGARAIPAQAIVTSIVPPQQRGSYMSISSSFQQLAMGLASFIAGQIVAEDAQKHLLRYDYVGYLSVCIGLVGLYMSVKLKSLGEKQAKMLAPEGLLKN